MINPSYQDMANMAFLALVVWREARNQPPEAKLAVAYSVIERVKKPGWWGSTIQTVIAKKWQYSSMTADDDPQLGLYPDDNDPQWAESLIAASTAINELEPNPAPEGVMYYSFPIKK